MEALLLENKQLRAQLVEVQRQLERVQAQTASARQEDSSEIFRFLDLTKKVRLEIYEYLLVPGVITPRWEDEMEEFDVRYFEISKKTHAETQLLLVCKEIRDEAEPVYLSANRFIMPIAAPELFYRRCRMIDPQIARHMTSLSISFDFRDISATFSFLMHQTLQGNVRVDDDYRLHKILVHDGLKTILCGRYRWVSEMTQCAHPRNLQISFMNCFCTMGCCRMFTEVEYHLFNLKELRYYAPKKVEIFGLKSKEERDGFRELLQHWRRGLGEEFGASGPSDSSLGVTFRDFTGGRRGEARWVEKERIEDGS